MTRNQSLTFRFLLFLVGAGIVVLAFFLLTGERDLTRVDGFVWTSIGLMYLVFFLPFFFSAIRVGNFSGKVPSLTLSWLSVILYISVSMAIIFLLVLMPFITINMAIIAQAVVLFLFAVSIYFAYFASSHVGNVAREEAGMRRNIAQLKPKAQSLLLAIGRLPAEYDAAQKSLRQAIEEIRFIYPVGGGAGDELELGIIRSLDTIREICDGISSGAYNAALEAEAEKLRMLVKERKLLKN